MTEIEVIAARDARYDGVVTAADAHKAVDDRHDPLLSARARWHALKDGEFTQVV